MALKDLEQFKKWQAKPNLMEGRRMLQNFCHWSIDFTPRGNKCAHNLAKWVNLMICKNTWNQICYLRKSATSGCVVWSGWNLTFVCTDSVVFGLFFKVFLLSSVLLNFPSCFSYFNLINAICHLPKEKKKKELLALLLNIYYFDWEYCWHNTVKIDSTYFHESRLSTCLIAFNNIHEFRIKLSNLHYRSKWESCKSTAEFSIEALKNLWRESLERISRAIFSAATALVSMVLAAFSKAFK